MMPSLDLVARAALETLRGGLPIILEAARGAVSPKACDLRIDCWSRRLLDHAGLRLEVSGREHMRPGTSYVVMSNHQSSYDIPVLFQALRIPLRMVAKKEVFQIPFLGRAIRAAGFVELDRENRRSAIRALVTAHQHLGESTSIWVAPEGTRSRTGRLGHFKRGGFRMAISSGMPILPVTIDGTRHALPAGRLTVRRGSTVRVTISAPIDPAECGPEGIDRLVAAVRDVIARHLSADWNLAALEMQPVEEKLDQGNPDFARDFHFGSRQR
jgi:1-acyl-sn-glycerol-3-phosphate acyltransferase